MSVDVLYQAEVPALAAVKTCLQAAIPVGSGTLRVDENVVDGQLTSPMCLITSSGPRWDAASMRGHDDIVTVRVVVTCIGESVELVTQLRGKVVRALTARNGTTGAYYEPLTVPGMRVVRRELTDRALPAVTFGAGWGNAVTPISLLLQPAA